MLFPMPITSLPNANSYHFEHKIEVFVRYLPSDPPLSSLFEHKIEVFVRFEISMTQDLDPRDNSIAERVNGIILD